MDCGGYANLHKLIALNEVYEPLVGDARQVVLVGNTFAMLDGVNQSGWWFDKKCLAITAGEVNSLHTTDVIFKTWANAGERLLRWINRLNRRLAFAGCWTWAPIARAGNTGQVDPLLEKPLFGAGEAVPVGRFNADTQRII